MLTELSISNFAIIEDLHLQLAPGFNVLTGETGAGKSIIIDAVTLLLGGRADTQMIRAGAEQARVEGIFVLDEPVRAALRPILHEYGVDEDEENLILTREVSASGRSVARINGRAVPVRALQEVSEWLVDIHGQTEHLSLLRPRTHVDFLDRYAGLEGLRQEVARRVYALREVRRELEKLRRDARQLARRMDLLQFQVQEIEDARLQPGEEEALLEERNLLANAERLLELSDAAYASLYGGLEGETSIVDRMSEVIAHLTQLEGLDRRLGEQRRLAEELSYQLQELARSLREYRDNLDFDPERLHQVEERLDLIFRLKRKYGDSIEEILAFGQRAAQELATLSHSEERTEELEEEEARLLKELGELCAELSAARREAVGRLCAAIEEELAELRMEQTRFAVDLKWVEDPQGVEIEGRRYAFDTTGVDQVEFLIAPNPGEPLRPLAKIASGGEASRLMLAMKAVLSAADPVPTLIFDEIDSGIGGRVGEVIGKKLWGLTAPGHLSHQVICVTHLPQLAAFADAHYQVSKQVVGQRTVTLARPVSGEDRLEEVTQMLGATTEVTRQKARELLEQTARWKAEQVAGSPLTVGQQSRVLSRETESK